jgi:hypothetical protein
MEHTPTKNKDATMQPSYQQWLCATYTGAGSSAAFAMAALGLSSFCIVAMIGATSPATLRPQAASMSARHDRVSLLHARAIFQNRKTVALAGRIALSGHR